MILNLTKLSKIAFIGALLVSIGFTKNLNACDAPAYTEGADRSYAVDDVISRNGVDYKVIIAGWANNSGSDWAYAPGTGTYWQQAWSVSSDPCVNTGGGGGGTPTCSDGIQNGDETGVDCGGSSCSPCGGGGTPTCSDGIQNGDETGVDCGGSSCSPCGGGGTPTCSDGIQNGDETGVDCGGSSCSPCGGGGGGGTSCIVTTDDGLAEATFYYLLEDGRSTVVTCSFDAVNDIKGTFYGALETARLHGSQSKSDPAKYCGMCASVTGPAGTAVVHIADECPDCKDKNTGDTDIDLSPQAFAAIVGSESIGRANITWEEVSCPWTSPIHVIVEGSNQWYAKVIIGNTVNRVDKVEVKQGSNYYELVRREDNGWESTGSPAEGQINETSKTFRVTDIYGEQIEVSGIDFTANPTNSKTDGPSNFTACRATNVQNIDPLDYISVFPNPANNVVTFDGLSGVQSVELYSTMGERVGSEMLFGSVDQVSVDISALSSGIYIAKFSSDSGIATKTFVKK